MKRTLCLWSICAVLGLFGAGCGDDSSDSGAEVPTMTCKGKNVGDKCNADDTAGDLDLRNVAHLLVEQALCNGGLDRNLTLLQVGLILTDDGVGHLLVESEVGHLNLRHDLHGVG